MPVQPVSACICNEPVLPDNALFSGQDNNSSSESYILTSEYGITIFFLMDPSYLPSFFPRLDAVYEIKPLLFIEYHKHFTGNGHNTCYEHHCGHPHPSL